MTAWLQAQPSTTDPKTERLQAAIDELTGLDDPSSAQRFQGRLTNVLLEPAGPHRNLLIDSLEVELGQVLRAARATATRLDEIRLDLAELSQLGAAQDHAALCRRFEEVLTDSASLAGFAADVSTAVASAKSASAAQARRDAVLQSLAALGYEVTEGLSTAWVADGKVVLRKADRPDYGVEISGGAAAARFQMRAVAFTGPNGGPDLSRDRDAETLWCGDVTALKADSAHAGGDLVIERALAIGTTPLKRIEIKGAAAQADIVRTPAQRTVEPR